jgi:hypothetical protein
MLPEGTCGAPFLVLARAVAPQGLRGLLGALYGASFAVLGFFEDVAGPGLA